MFQYKGKRGNNAFSLSAEGEAGQCAEKRMKMFNVVVMCNSTLWSGQWEKGWVECRMAGLMEYGV